MIHKSWKLEVQKSKPKDFGMNVGSYSYFNSLFEQWTIIRFINLADLCHGFQFLWIILFL